jgi:hypothetical protein
MNGWISKWKNHYVDCFTSYMEMSTLVGLKQNKVALTLSIFHPTLNKFYTTYSCDIDQYNADL